MRKCVCHALIQTVKKLVEYNSLFGWGKFWKQTQTWHKMNKIGNEKLKSVRAVSYGFGLDWIFT